MTISQSARYKAYLLTLAHVMDNEAITKGVPAIAQACAEMKTKLDAIAEADNLRQQSVVAVSAGKKQYRDQLARESLHISSAIVSYADEINNAQLREAMDFTATELYRERDPLLGAKAANILAEAKAIAAALKNHGVSEEQLNNYAVLVNDYIKVSAAPRRTVTERKEAGQTIRMLLTQVRELFTMRLDKLLLPFKDSHPAFYLQYLNKRKVVNPAQRKTQVNGTVTDVNTETGISGVTVMLKEAGLQTVTLPDGTYSLSVPITGMVHLEFQKEGYSAAAADVTLSRGQISRLQLSMKPVS